MKIVIAIAVLCLSVLQVSAQRTDIAVEISQISPIDTETRTFYFSADPRATIGVDTAFDELEIPTITPPAGIFYIWTVVEAPEIIWLSPLDIRKLRSEKYVEEYHFHAEWQGTKLQFGLLAGLPQFVDSIYLVDDYVEWPNSIVKFKMESGQRYDITNQSLLNFVLRVYYDGTSVGVDDETTSAHEMMVAPNPITSDVFDVRNLSTDASTLEVVDVRGVVCASYDVAGGEAKGLAIHDLPSGAYILIERRTNGSSRHCMFIRP